MFRFVCDNSGPREVVSNSLTMVPSLIPNCSRKFARNFKAKNKFNTSYHTMANGATETANFCDKKSFCTLKRKIDFAGITSYPITWDNKLPC